MIIIIITCILSKKDALGFERIVAREKFTRIGPLPLVKTQVTRRVTGIVALAITQPLILYDLIQLQYYFSTKIRR